MLKNLKSLFVKEEGKEDKKGQADQEAKEESTDKSSPQDATSEEEFVESIKPASSDSPSSETDVSPQDTKGTVSDKFMDILLGAMKKNNREGFDYMEYKQSLQSLKKMEMDEATRFQSAFAMAQTMGATKDNIASSAAYYLDVLKQEKKKFQGVVANQNTKQVVSKEQGAEDVLKAIQNKENQIKKLQEDIENLKAQYSSANKEIALSKTKVEKTKNDFLVTYDLLESQIMKDVSLIKKYLQ